MSGVTARFRELDSLVEAIGALKQERGIDIDVYMPTPRHEVSDAVDPPISGVRKYTLIGGACGATFGYWVAIWTSDYWPLVVGGKAIATWVPYTIFGFEVMVLVGGLATVYAMFGLAGLPRLTTTVGYDPRFSAGDYGVWVETTSDRADEAMDLLRRHGAREVRSER